MRLYLKKEAILVFKERNDSDAMNSGIGNEIYYKSIKSLGVGFLSFLSF